MGSAVFCKNTKKAERVAKKLDTGMTFINTFTVSDSRLPYGGVKNSGYGRECSIEGIHEFANIKPIWIKE